MIVILLVAIVARIRLLLQLHSIFRLCNQMMEQSSGQHMQFQVRNPFGVRQRRLLDRVKQRLRMLLRDLCPSLIFGQDPIHRN